MNNDLAKKKVLEAGKLVGVHGIKGELKILPMCDSPEILASFDTLYIGKNYSPVNILHSRVQKNIVIAKLQGYDSPEAAEKLRNCVLFLNRDDLVLDDGVFFIQDLIGLTVKDADSGFVYGVLDDVLQTGANDVYSIKDDNGKSTLIPAIPDVVKLTDIDGGFMLISPLEGLFDNEN